MRIAIYPKLSDCAKHQASRNLANLIHSTGWGIWLDDKRTAIKLTVETSWAAIKEHFRTKAPAIAIRYGSPDPPDRPRNWRQEPLGLGYPHMQHIRRGYGLAS